MDKIYIVTCGNYSDYRIERAFCDKHKAELFSTYFYDGRVEEYEVSDGLVDDGREYFHVGVTMWFNESHMQLSRVVAYANVVPDHSGDFANLRCHFKGEYILDLRLIYSNQRVPSKDEARKLGVKTAEDFVTLLQSQIALGATSYDLDSIVKERNKKYMEEGVC